MALRFLAVAVLIMTLAGFGRLFSCSPPPRPIPKYPGVVAFPSREAHPGQTNPRPLGGFQNEIPIYSCLGCSSHLMTLYSWYDNNDDRPLKAYFPPSVSSDPAEQTTYYNPQNAGTYHISTDNTGLIINAERQDQDRGEERFHVVIKTTDSWPESTWTLYFYFRWE